MNPRHSIFSWLLPACILIIAESLQAQSGSTRGAITIRGKITSVRGQELSVAAPGGVVRVQTADSTIIRREIPVNFLDITTGMYLGTTAAKQPDGTFRASEVHIFSEDQRGIGEGHRPSSTVPNSTMTNADVENVEDVVVHDVKGRMMTLKYKGGEVKVLVPADIPIVKRVTGDRLLLKAGAEISIQGTRSADGTLTASQITVRAPQAS
jgi:hypothetical protein